MGQKKQRAHKPHELGPRLEKRGRWWTADLRPWGGKRYTSLRDPSDLRWPEAGERTETRADAERWKWVYVDRVEELKAKRTKRKLSLLVEDYLDHRAQTVTENTWLNDRSVLKAHFLPFFDEDEEPQLDLDALQKFFNELLREGYAHSTVSTMKICLSAFYKWAGHEGALRKIVLPKAPKEEVTFWSGAEIALLREAAEEVGPRATLVLELGLATGARKGELVALRWRDFDPRQGSVRITHQMVRGKRVPLKGKRPRTALVLPNWWRFHQQTGGSEYVLGGIGDWTAYRAFVDVMEKAGLNRTLVGLHSLRHTYSRLCLEKEISLRQLQSFLGHEHLNTTERFYGHLSDEAAISLGRAKVYGPPKLEVVQDADTQAEKPRAAAVSSKG